jgi:glutathione S-transferase
VELKYSPLSPFARKALVTAHETGVFDRLRLTQVNVRDEPHTVTPFNPLGKIPVLIADDGAAIYDSPVICEYLDATFGGNHLIASSGPDRWDVMTRVALADGMVDAAILVRLERVRAAERQSAGWIESQMRKVTSALNHFEQNVSAGDKPLDMGDIALGCALGYMPLRVPDFVGYPSWPRLKVFYEHLCARPSFAQTLPSL